MGEDDATGTPGELGRSEKVKQGEKEEEEEEPMSNLNNTDNHKSIEDKDDTKKIDSNDKKDSSEEMSASRVAKSSSSPASSPRGKEDEERSHGSGDKDNEETKKKEKIRANSENDDKSSRQGEDKTGKKKSRILSRLQQADRTLSLEDKTDVVDHQVEQNIRRKELPSDLSSPTAKLQKKVIEAAEQFQADASFSPAATTPQPSTRRDGSDENDPFNATAPAASSRQGEDKILPKKSNDTEFERRAEGGGSSRRQKDDENTSNDNKKQKRPVSGKYLEMLERQKSKSGAFQRQRNPQRNSRYSFSSEPSEIARILKQREASQRWADPRESSVRFKSQYEEMMFRSMQKVCIRKNTRGSDDEKKQSKDGDHRSPLRKSKTKDQGGRRHNKEAYERLSAAKKQDMSLFYIQNESGRKYASFDDAKNCTFTPRTNEAKKKKQQQKDDRDSREEEKDSHSQSFLLRQEANERKRLNEMLFQKGKQEYEARVDKKQCPSCHAVQSYDEVKEKRKNCPNCRKPYTHKTNWSHVQQSFFQRQNEAYVSGVRALEEKRREVLEGERRSCKVRVDESTGEVITMDSVDSNPLYWTKDVEEDFFGRLHEHNVKKERKIKALDEEIYGSVGKSSNRRPKSSDSFSFSEQFDSSLYF